MKKSILFLFVATLMLSLYSCSSDDDDKNDNDNVQNIVGKWDFVKSYAEVEATPASVKKEIEDEISYQDKECPVSYQFFEGSTLIYRENCISFKEIYTIKGDNLTTIGKDMSGKEQTGVYQFSIKNNTLVIKFDDPYAIRYLEAEYPDAKITKYTYIREFEKIK